MIHLSSIRLIQSLIFVYCGFFLTAGYLEKCSYELENDHDCIQWRCPINKCGNFRAIENMTCVCAISTATCMSDKVTTQGCVAIRIAGDDQKYEVKPCMEARPFICSDSINNFQIYAEENVTWSEALHTCEERNLHIAQVNLSTLNHTSSALFWVGSFYSSVSTSEIDLSNFEMTFDSQEIKISSTDSIVRCEIQSEEFRKAVGCEKQSEVFRTTTSSVRPTSREIPQTTNIDPTTYFQTTRLDRMITRVTGDSRDDGDVPHSYTAVIVGAISGCVVLIIIGVSVVYVRKSRNNRKPQNNTIQMADIVSIAGYTDQSLRGKSRANEQAQNPIYLPHESTSDNALANLWCDKTVELHDESNYNLFEMKHISNDIESENDTYDHTRLDIQVDSINGYGVLHQREDGITDDVYDHVGTNEGTYGHLHQKDETSRPDSDTYVHTSDFNV